MNPGIHPVLSSDKKKLLGLDSLNVSVAGFPDSTPLAWWQKFDGGREFYVAIGHNKEDYENPILYHLIDNGILWAMKR
jgi:type 1 glutamine amidotransferase